MKRLSKTVERAVKTFQLALGEKYPFLTQEGMEKMWKDMKKKKCCSKKMNCYNLFVRVESEIIQRQHPEMSFSERSREMSRRWKVLLPKEKDHYRHRAKLHQTYQFHENWKYYMEKSREYVFHVAKNWFEEDPSVTIHESLSQEELVELLLLYTHVDDTTNAVGAETETLTPSPLHEEASKIVKDIPLEVHPYYYQLVQKSLEALHQLCDKNFSPEMWKDNAANRRALMELLIRHFDHLELE